MLLYLVDQMPINITDYPVPGHLEATEVMLHVIAQIAQIMPSFINHGEQQYIFIE